MISENMDGLARLLRFLSHLRERKVHFSVSSHRDDSIMVTFTVIGARVEVDFFENHFEYSVFKGSEDVEDDEAALLGIIENFVRE